MYVQSGRGTELRRLSSLVLDSPTMSASPARRPVVIDTQLKRLCKNVYETVPDSEEEASQKTQARERTPSPAPARLPTKDTLKTRAQEIIIISSDSEDELPLNSPEPDRKKASGNEDPFLGGSSAGLETGHSAKTPVEDSSGDDYGSDIELLHLPKVGTKGKNPRTRRTVLSDSENSEGKEEDRQRGEADDDDAILELNDPPTTRRPLPKHFSLIKKLSTSSPLSDPFGDIKVTPGGGRLLESDRTPVETPVAQRFPGAHMGLPDYFAVGSSPTKGKAKGKTTEKSKVKEIFGPQPESPSGLPSKITTPVSESPVKKKAQRVSKKALKEAKEAALKAYAQELFTELNEIVFKNALPPKTGLIWNNRLSTTAGRAKWHYSQKTDEETTEIELATKILDCEERIRNTLSHEMCHLACWVINRDPKEAHGRMWTEWTKKVMKKRPDIHISRKHTYEIDFKYQWKCLNTECNKIYGRHSKSIDHEKSICGICKTGDLLPLFPIRAKKTEAAGRLASKIARDSPTTIDRLLTNRTPVVVPLHLGNSICTSNVNASDTEDESHNDCIAQPSPTRTTLSVIRPTSIPVPSKADAVEAETGLSGLIKHFSIIDLTGD